MGQGKTLQAIAAARRALVAVSVILEPLRVVWMQRRLLQD
jgi:hypothetical protein